VFYDLGANHGIYTCFAGTLLTAGDIVAFEPNPNTVAELRRNIKLNELMDRATVFQAAVDGEAGQGEFFADTDSMGSSLAESRQGLDTKAIEVDIVALDELAGTESLPAPDVVKIDVEGAELRALRGMRSLLEDRCRLLYCEVHNHAIADFSADPEDVSQFLRNVGFTVTSVFDRESQHILKATR
jgi:FkbM family methyltransferase